MAIVDHRVPTPVDAGAPERTDRLDLDRWERGVLRHMLLALALGLAAGAAGGALHAAGLSDLAALFDPYVYLALAVLVGGAAAGPGWALLGALLAGVGPVSSSIALGGLRGGVDPPHGAPLDVAAHPEVPALGTIAAVVLCGLAAYALRRLGERGRRGRRSR